MMQSVPRAIAHHLTTNWPILWAARLDVPLVSGLLLLVLEVPIFLLGRKAEQQLWGVGEPGDWKLNVSAVRGFMWMAVLSIALGAVILWLISMRRVYVRGISTRMVEHPSFIDIVLGTFMIVTPIVVFGSAVPTRADTGPLSDVGFQSFLNPTLIIVSAVYSSILATILTGIMRSSLKMVLLSLLVGLVIAVLNDVALSAAISRLFPAIADYTARNVLFASFLVWLIWMSYGTTRIWARERLLSIAFPSLIFFVLSIQSLISALIASTGVEWSDKLKLTLLSRENPVAMSLFVVILIVLGEVLSRRWARLSQMPK